MVNTALKTEPSSVSQVTGAAKLLSARDVWIKDFTTISAPVFKSIVSPRDAWIKESPGVSIVYFSGAPSPSEARKIMT